MIKQKDMQRFASRYAEEEQELLVLTSESVGGAGSWGKGLWEPSAGLLAYIDPAGELHQEGCLSWLAEDNMQPRWGFGIKPLTIYRIKARALKDGPAAGKYFMLLAVLAEMDAQPQLEPIRQAYLQPVNFWDGELGAEFTLDRQFDCFDADVDWLGSPCHVFLECDDDETAEAARATFKQMYANLAEWDAKFRAQAAADLTENANDWQQDAVEEGEEYQKLTEADFRRRITISEFSLNPEGDFSVYYDDDNLFWGHVIIVEGNVDGRLEEAYIAG